MPDLMVGQVQVYFCALPASLGFIRAGKLRALAVTTARRVELLPDIPAVAEFVPGYEAVAWQGLGVPKGTPAEIVEKLNMEVGAFLADAKIRARLSDIGVVPTPMAPAAFGKFIADETRKWSKVVEVANIKVD